MECPLGGNSLNQQFSNSHMQHLVKTHIWDLNPRVADSVGLGLDPKTGIHNIFWRDADAAGLGDHTSKTTSLNAVLMCLTGSTSSLSPR